jgi:C-terminal domain of Sin3a protein
LLQLLYSRLLVCKGVGAKLANEKHVSFLENPIAVELGLDDPNGPSAVLAQAVEALGDQLASEGSNVVYLYLLDACEKVFDNELDQATFEEHMRWFFGNKVGFYSCHLLGGVTDFRIQGVSRLYTRQADYRIDQAGKFCYENLLSVDKSITFAHSHPRYRPYCRITNVRSSGI